MLRTYSLRKINFDIFNDGIVPLYFVIFDVVLNDNSENYRDCDMFVESCISQTVEYRNNEMSIIYTVLHLFAKT